MRPIVPTTASILGLLMGVAAYVGGILRAPSRRMVSPLSVTLSPIADPAT